MRDNEYDRFGPWVIKITDKDPLPPLFVPYIRRDEIPQLSIKIPRIIERRNAHPGMNLYDYVVNLYSNDMIILERIGDDVESKSFLYEEIECLSYKEELLSGNLNLVMANKSFNLPFNTVSGNIMQRLVNLIRQKYIDTTRNENIVNQTEFTDINLSFFFTGLLTEGRKLNPEFKVFASQIETPVTSIEPSGFKKLIYGVIGKRLLESLHLSDGRELKILNRGKTFRYRGQATYGKEILYIPLNKITNIAWSDNQKIPGILHLTISTSGGSYQFAFVQNNPSAETYAQVLKMVIR